MRLALLVLLLFCAQTVRVDFMSFPVGFPTSKLVAAYYFDEAVGTYVGDKAGSRWLSLAEAPSPNVTLTSQGIHLESGLAQTPTLPGVRAVSMLYKVQPEATGSEFIISGGSSSTDGALVEQLTVGETHKVVASGFDMHTPHTGSTGHQAYELTRGQWVSYYLETPSAYTSKFGFGGSYSSTFFRAKSMDVNCAFFWNAPLTTGEFDIVNAFIRERGKAKGIYIHRDDAPRKIPMQLIAGESTADGRADFSGLTGPDLAEDLGLVDIAANSGQANVVKISAFDLGVNQNSVGPKSYVGPEFGLAIEMQANGGGAILKYAVGGSFLSPSSLNGRPSWNVAEPATTGLLWLALRQWQDSLQDMLSRGIGASSIQFNFIIGLNDATNISYASSASVYQGYLQDMLDAIEAQFAGMPITMKIVRPHTNDPASNATAMANIRAGIAAFATANANVTMVDGDSYSLMPDNAHQNAAGVKAMGADLY